MAKLEKDLDTLDLATKVVQENISLRESLFVAIEALKRIEGNPVSGHGNTWTKWAKAVATEAVDKILMKNREFSK